MRARIISRLQLHITSGIIQLGSSLNEGQDYIPATTGLTVGPHRCHWSLNEGQDYIPATTRASTKASPAVNAALNEGQDYIPATTSLIRPARLRWPTRSMRARIISRLQLATFLRYWISFARRSMRARIISRLQPVQWGGCRSEPLRSMRARIISRLQRYPPELGLLRFPRSMRARIISRLQLVVEEVIWNLRSFAQ